MTAWFTYFINVIVYFIYISEYYASIILLELSVLFLDRLFQPVFHCKCLITYHTHCLTFFMGVLASVIYWSSFFFFTYVTVFFQMFYVNMLQEMLFSNYFLIFQITSTYLFLPSSHQCFAFNFRPHDFKGIIDRLIHMLLIYNLFHNVHDNIFISKNHFSWLCFQLWFKFFPLIFVVL